MAPIAAVRRLSPFRTKTIHRVAPGVVSCLLDHAEVLTEGAMRPGSKGAQTYFGTTMVTIELRHIEQLVRLPKGRQGEAMLERIVSCAQMRIRLLRMARLEAERKCVGMLPGTMHAEIDTRIDDHRLLVDIDVELPMEDDSHGEQELCP